VVKPLSTGFRLAGIARGCVVTAAGARLVCI
jgi:hypothetical protein